MQWNIHSYLQIYKASFSKKIITFKNLIGSLIVELKRLDERYIEMKEYGKKCKINSKFIISGLFKLRSNTLLYFCNIDWKNYFTVKQCVCVCWGGERGKEGRIIQMRGILILEGKYSEGSTQNWKTQSQIRTMHHTKVFQSTHVLKFIAVVLILQPSIETCSELSKASEMEVSTNTVHGSEKWKNLPQML